jgi:molecular chaperone GrpE
MASEKSVPTEESPGGSPAPAGTPPPPTPPPPPPQAEADGADWETRFKYLLADFENFRRRSERDREGIRLRERADLLRSLLPLYEALERARHAAAKGPKHDPIRKGLDLVAHEMDSFLERSGVVPVASVGRPFDAAEHEALVDAPPTPKCPEGTIVEIVQQGYRFPGGLLRPAKVVIARAPAPPAPSETPPAAAGGRP